MVKSRVLEERLLKIYKAGDAYFWIGAPGEEAWGVPLGLLINKGRGPEHDFLHLHYRATPTLIALGMEMIDSIRLIMNRATDPSTGGRNFANHYCFPQWNIIPVTSPIEVQYVMALGTARVQKRLSVGGEAATGERARGITVVTGGDAGTAEGDFASCLVWSSRPGQELPLLITVQNNRWGISTSYQGQHGETRIADRASAFNMRSRVIDGCNPIETYLALEEEMTYIRRTGKPSFIEARVSRMYGHSSASGANLISEEVDPVRLFEERLLRAGHVSEKLRRETWDRYERQGVEAQQTVRSEPGPKAETLWDHVYAGNENADWRKF
ncbi:MAG: 3-methyl-2-oxobutanoate dehydrogenase [Bdellovibrio sp.]|nr:MAG: 3-methyl-2-oxobutanoate dehydrogenase [Bdellovibrio sp.]